MDNTTIQKLKDAIAKSNSIGIAVGQNPSVDIMGAALALYLLLKTAKKQVSIASPSDPIVEISSLVGIDKVQRNFGGEAGDMVVSFPYQEGEIEKVSYTLENNFLNIIVKASEQGLSFSEKDVRYSHGSGSIDLLIVIGAANLNEIGDVIDSQKLGNISIINIDNKSNNQNFGDIVLVSPQASSISEHVADIVLTLGFSVEQDAAQNLLSGIMTATKNFQDPKTSSLAFEVSAFLMKRGAQRIGAQPARYPQQNQKPQDTNQLQRESRPQGQQPNQQQNQPVPDNRPPRPAVQQQQAQPAQNQPRPSQQPQQNNAQGNDAPPLDWLTPKVYKGSSEV
ncbi:MAG: DHH family phosphoesterase [Candidatus Levyibacteriota bacterium]